MAHADWHIRLKNRKRQHNTLFLSLKYTYIHTHTEKTWFQNMGRFRAVRPRAFLSFHDIKHTQDPTFIFFSNFFPKILHYTFNVRFCSDAPKNSWISAPGPNWDSLCTWALIAMQSLLCWVLRDAVIMKPTKTMQQITACKHTHTEKHIQISHMDAHSGCIHAQALHVNAYVFLSTVF